MRDRPANQIEDLDPVPRRAGAREYRLERALGLLLVGGLVLFGLAQWHANAVQADAYRAGARAAAAYDWDAAQVAFTAADGYADAARRAADATHQAAERDTQYAVLRQAAAAGDWPRAAVAAIRLAAVAPAYRDTAQLSSSAQAHVLAAALTGAVARRMTPAPGLYAFAAGAWHLLPGSDAASAPLSACGTASLLYDAPPGAGAAGGVPATAGIQSGPGRLAGRRLLVSTRAGRLLTTRTLDTGGYEDVACSAGGVWAATHLDDTAALQAAEVMVVPARGRYQAFGSTQVVTPTLPGPNWYIIGFAPTGDRILLLDANQLAGAQPRTQLYVAGNDGGQRRLLADLPGASISPQFTPDGRHVLLLVRQPDPGQVSGTISLLLAAVDAPAGPQVLAQVPVDSTRDTGAFGLMIAHGPRAGQVLFMHQAGPNTVIRLIDPARPARQPQDLAFDQDQAGLVILAGSAGDGGLLLGGQGAVESGGAGRASFIYVDPADRVHTGQVPLDGTDELRVGWLRGGRLVYATDSRANGGPGSGPFTLHSLPLAALDAPDPRPTDLYTGTVGVESGGGVGSFAPGPGLLAYITPSGELRARSYDGAVDLRLDSGFAGFAPLGLFAWP